MCSGAANGAQWMALDDIYLHGCQLRCRSPSIASAIPPSPIPLPSSHACLPLTLWRANSPFLALRARK